ncbi:MAG TPA: glycosyltransferase [Polyangiaceae bacterium]|nr:glycosyltransferase [Polyangiaceae bacterium]
MLTLTVVIATFNRGRLLARLMRDLAAQDLVDPTSARRAFDVILVDDGSREPVRALAREWSLPFSIELIEQANAGQAAARDRGIRAARGEVIVVVDDDMQLPPHFLREHLRHHEDGATLVLGCIRPPEHLEQLHLFVRFLAWKLEQQQEAMRGGERPRGASLCTGNVSFRRSDYLAVGGFDRSLAQSEDRDLGIRLEEAGARIVFSYEAYTLHDSDHASLERHLQRAFRYGIYDSRISAKYPRLEYINPWRFLFLVNPISRPFLLLAATSPGTGAVVSKVAMTLAQRLADAGWEAPALRGTTLVYGIEYFRGLRHEAGSLRSAIKGLSSYVRQTRDAT